MNMKCCFLLFLCIALNSCQEVSTANDHDVKRGMHSFMAFIYYSDPTVVDISKQRFIRSAVLIRSDWLVTTAIGPSLMDSPNGFPQKTLLARAGAIAIDSKFTLNEDEDEQEQEVVQIVRPYNHSATQWWTTDISLMKTLLPFKLTSAVGIQTLSFKPAELIDPKTCSVLVFAKKYGNDTEDKNLMVLFVDLLPPSIRNCGSHFTAGTMACAADSDDNKDAVYDPEFCQGNSGGPLICSNEVVGLQTYIGNDCKQPHLYQLFFPWDNFITCGIEEKCQEEHCGVICDAIFKDQPKTEEAITPPVTHDTAQDIIAFLNVPSTTTVKTTTTESISVSSTTVTAITTTAAFGTLSELVTEETAPVNVSDVTTIKEIEATTPETTINIMIMSESAVTETTEKLTVLDETSRMTTRLTEKHTSTSWLKLKSDNENYKRRSSSVLRSTTKPNTRPKEKLTGDKNINNEEVERKIEVERKTEVETQLQSVDEKSPIQFRSVAKRNMIFSQTVFFGFIVLLCL